MGIVCITGDRIRVFVQKTRILPPVIPTHHPHDIQQTLHKPILHTINNTHKTLILPNLKLHFPSLQNQVSQAAAICITLELLMMGITVPETRWAFYFHVLKKTHGQTHIKCVCDMFINFIIIIIIIIIIINVHVLLHMCVLYYWKILDYTYLLKLKSFKLMWNYRFKIGIIRQT